MSVYSDGYGLTIQIQPHELCFNVWLNCVSSAASLLCIVTYIVVAALPGEANLQLIKSLIPPSCGQVTMLIFSRCCGAFYTLITDGKRPILTLKRIMTSGKK